MYTTAFVELFLTNNFYLAFVNMLNEMRLGFLSPQSIERFQRLSRDIVYDDGVGATEL